MPLPPAAVGHNQKVDNDSPEVMYTTGERGLRFLQFVAQVT
jgi:hypothetical protein